MVDNFVNTPDNNTMIIALTFYNDDGEVVSGSRYIEQVRAVIGPIVDEHPEVDTYVTGGDAIQTDIELSVDEDVSRIDPVTIILILVLIGLFFRSFVAAAVPPMIIGIGLGISFALVYFLGTYFMDVHYSVLTILLTASLGAGCDYCIFILSRYREERRKGYDKKAAVETSVTWAGEAIATSGLTVIIAFGALSLEQHELHRLHGGAGRRHRLRPAAGADVAASHPGAAGRPHLLAQPFRSRGEEGQGELLHPQRQVLHQACQGPVDRGGADHPAHHVHRPDHPHQL